MEPLLPASASSTEILRLGAALYGLWIAWKGYCLVRSYDFKVPRDLLPERLREVSADWSDRMDLYATAQVSIMLVHLLLLVNVSVNLFYPSPTLEQPNVATSNLMQLLIPFILVRLSELIARHIRRGERMAVAHSEDGSPSLM